MSSLARTVLVVLAVLGLTASLAAVAQADTIYVGWRSSPTNRVASYDVGTGATLLDPLNDPLLKVQTQGLAISPLDGLLYAILSDNKTIRKFDPLTGQDKGVFATTAGTTRPIAIDSNGYLYAGLGYSTSKEARSIAKYAPDGTLVNATWGSPPIIGSTYYFANDLEIRDGKLYGSSGYGVVYWDLSTGGDPTSVLFTNNSPGVDGIAFGPDGTLYTGHCDDKAESPNARSVRMTAPPYTTLGPRILSLDYTGNYINDVDYWAGKVYAAGNKYVYRYDGQNWDQFLTGSPTATGTSGHMAFMIPEPSTLALLAGGLLGLLCYAWRKRR